MPQRKNKSVILPLSLGVTLAVVAAALSVAAVLSWLKMQSEAGVTDVGVNPSSPGKTTSTVPNRPVQERMSAGEKLLIPVAATPVKKAAAKAMTSGNYADAVSQLEASLKNYPNDPEALIYLNNARIGKQKSYTLAVSVPIGSDVNGAKEMLRGVAQAQNEVNRTGGIKGVPLKVLIANDDNNPNVAKQIASTLVKNPDVLGVIGHNASDVTLATADLYQSGELVAISPISSSVKLSGKSPYVFRTVPSDSVAAKTLANYMLQTLKQQKVAVFFNSQSGYSQSLKSEFVAAVSQGGGQVVDEFDLSDPNFNATQSLSQSFIKGAQVLMLAANTGTLDKALQVVQVNDKRLSVLAGDDVYTAKTLQVGAKAAENTVVAIPWHILGNPQAEFPKAATQLWGAEVSWRTAMAYDAAKALIAAIARNPTGPGVQQALLAPDFSATGAAGAIRFLPSGDRNQPVQLVKIQAGKRSGLDYEFVPIPK